MEAAVDETGLDRPGSNQGGDPSAEDTVLYAPQQEGPVQEGIVEGQGAPGTPPSPPPTEEAPGTTDPTGPNTVSARVGGLEEGATGRV